MATKLVMKSGGLGGTASSAAPAGERAQNVKVAVRIRPFNKRERGLGAESVVEVAADKKSVTISNPKADKPAEMPPKTFGEREELSHARPSFIASSPAVFDHAYGWDSAQSTLYEDLGKPIVEQALRGFNGTIFAYGQTGRFSVVINYCSCTCSSLPFFGAGSGKTFSMMGDDASPGIIPLLNRELFDRVRVMHAEKPDRELMVIVSFLEIYNECIKVRGAPDMIQADTRTLPVAHCACTGPAQPLGQAAHDPRAP